MAKMKSDAHLWLSEVGDAAPVPVNITSVTKANPSVVTLAAAGPAGMAIGDFVEINGTAEAKLDTHSFRIAAVDVSVPAAPKLTLADFDGTKLTAAVAAKGTATVYTKAGTAGLIPACLVNITVAGVAPDSIQMDDMCDSTTVLGSPKPPTFSFSGFVKKTDPGFKNLVAASLEDPKLTHVVLVDYTDLGGYIIGPGQVGEVTITAQTAQGLQFSGTGVFTEVPTYSWAL